MIHLSNAQYIGTREEQQDAFGFSNATNQAFLNHGGVMAVVADGMGGLSCGAEVAQTAVKAFIATYEAKTSKDSVSSALWTALAQANSAVLEFVRDAGVEEKAATTIVAAAIQGDSLHWVAAGDSRAYLIRNGSAYRLSRDHALGAELDEALASVVTSFLGAAEIPKTDRNLRAFPLAPDDLVLLCSDGLYRSLDDKEIAEEARRGQENLEQASRRLIDRVISKGLPEQDNVTVLTIAADRTSGVASRARRPAVLRWIAALIALLAVVDVALILLAGLRERYEEGSRAIGTEELQSPTEASTPPRR